MLGMLGELEDLDGDGMLDGLLGVRLALCRIERGTGVLPDERVLQECSVQV